MAYIYSEFPIYNILSLQDPIASINESEVDPHEDTFEMTDDEENFEEDEVHYDTWEEKANSDADFQDEEYELFQDRDTEPGSKNLKETRNSVK